MTVVKHTVSQMLCILISLFTYFLFHLSFFHSSALSKVINCELIAQWDNGTSLFSHIHSTTSHIYVHIYAYMPSAQCNKLRYLLLVFRCFFHIRVFHVFCWPFEKYLCTYVCISIDQFFIESKILSGRRQTQTQLKSASFCCILYFLFQR